MSAESTPDDSDEFQLDEIVGVGSDTADDLRDEGFETVASIADASVSALAETDGFGTSRAEDVQANAQQLLAEPGSGSDQSAGADNGELEASNGTVGGDDSAGELEANAGTVGDGDGDGGLEASDGTVAGDSVADDDSAEADPSDGATYDLTLDVEFGTLYHVVHIVLEEATKQHQSSNYPMRNTTYGLATDLMDHVVTNAPTTSCDQTVTVELSVTKAEVNALYRALQQGSTDYASRSGIPGMWGELDRLADEASELRRSIIGG